MTIHIESLSFDTVIGILDFERQTPQKVNVDITIDYHYHDQDFINYADVAQCVESMMIKNQYELLEEALEDISKSIIDNYSQINSLFLKISKPDILANAVVSVSNAYQITQKNNNS
jgi:dihydroneopterin aldolase